MEKILNIEICPKEAENDVAQFICDNGPMIVVVNNLIKRLILFIQ